MYLSIIVPIYNEEENLNEIARRLVQVLERIGPYEIVFVDDGSVDGSAEIIGRLCGVNPSVKAIHFSRNFGPDCSDVGILQQILEFFFACCCHICYIAYSLVVGSCTGGSIMKGGSRGRR